MSADNWGNCPRCFKRATDSVVHLVKKANDSYGKIPVEKYLQLVEEANGKFEPSEFITLREDYAIGIDRFGVFRVEYNARCTSCGFNYNYTHEKQL